MISPRLPGCKGTGSIGTIINLRPLFLIKQGIRNILETVGSNSNSQSQDVDDSHHKNLKFEWQSFDEDGNKEIIVDQSIGIL